MPAAPKATSYPVPSLHLCSNIYLRSHHTHSPAAEKTSTTSAPPPPLESLSGFLTLAGVEGGCLPKHGTPSRRGPLEIPPPKGLHVGAALERQQRCSPGEVGAAPARCTEPIHRGLGTDVWSPGEHSPPSRHAQAIHHLLYPRCTPYTSS